MRTFSTKGKVKAIERAIRAFKQEIREQNAIWRSYEEWLNEAHSRPVPPPQRQIDEVVEAQECIETDVAILLQEVESLCELAVLIGGGIDVDQG